jgi:quercetin dioxygenase-like cupin family protein
MIRASVAMLAAGMWLALSSTSALAADDPAETKFITPEEIKYVDNPLRPGAQMAVLEGDPKQPGTLIIRVKFPAGFKIPPHWHPHGERFVVLSGSMLEGIGEEFDLSKAKLLTAGSVGIFQAKTPHYIEVKEDVIVQVHTVGPLQTFPVKQP